MVKILSAFIEKKGTISMICFNFELTCTIRHIAIMLQRLWMKCK